MNRPLVIYHANCADGFGAAFAAWVRFGDDAEYLPLGYEQREDWFDSTFQQDEVVSTLDGREIYILDFSFSREITDYLLKHAGRVVWLDHHKTAFEMWCPSGEFELEYYDNMDGQTNCEIGNRIILDKNKSGAMLAWEYFVPERSIPDLIKYIDDRDRWQFKLKGTAELSAGLYAQRPWRFEQWETFVNDPSTFHEVFTEGKALTKACSSYVMSKADKAMKCNITTMVSYDGLISHTGLAVNSTIHDSELGHELAVRSGTYGLIWHMREDGRIKCSLRSYGDYDVSAIAKHFGGGGHKNAAGFDVDVQTLLRILGQK
jgi:uncharacterized protein